MEIKKAKLRIGVTGGIGTGKTTVCRIFEALGYPIFYADTEAKHVMVSDPELVEQIKAAFGEEVYTKEGNLDRKLLSSMVFHDRAKLDALNALVHPATLRAYENWERQQDAPLSFKEAALLFETGSYRLSDYNILVIAPQELRVKRVMERDQVTRESVLDRIDKQMSDEAKRELADFIIDNNENSALIPQVLKVTESLLASLST
ncbi:dephospho-CoA kinase [Olivibacter sp. XZL3]|uniref:dephospho-CoA kinase n=1 Tax=Olivibacter sp. XZL3 TaxID=1735116 RepID=UPI001066BA78|nr:dephospho-CoA kinase [Olivibacter sp. XZL3]